MSPGVLAAAYGHAPYRGEASPPTVRSSFTGGTPYDPIDGGQGGTSYMLTIPASPAPQVGDIGLIAAYQNQAGTETSGHLPTTPTGWTLIGRKESTGEFDTSNAVPCMVYMREMEPGDAGTEVTIALGAGASDDCMVGVGVIIAGSSGFGEMALATDFLTGVEPNLAVTDFPSVIPGPQDLVVLFGGARSSLQVGTGGSLISSPNPSSITIVQNFGDSNNALTESFAAFLLTGTAAELDNFIPTQVSNASDNYWRMGGAITFAPAGRTPSVRVPRSLIGGKFYGFGESLLTFAPFTLTEGATSNGANQNYAHMCESIHFQRLKFKLQPAGYTDGDLYNDYGIGGSWANDICGYSFGTVVYNAQVGTTDASNSWVTAATWTPLSGDEGASTLIMLEMLGNNALQDGETGPGNGVAPANGASSFTVSPKFWKNALNSTDALIRLMRCSAIKYDSDSTVVFTGTWTADTSFNDVSPNNSCHYTTTPGDHVTITTTKADIDVILLGLDNANAGQTGAAFTVTVDGSPWTPSDPGGIGYPTTTSDQTQKSNYIYNNATHTQLAVPCRGMGAGTHTIVVTHAGSGGQYLYFALYLEQELSPPPWICLGKMPTNNVIPSQGINWAAANALLGSTDFPGTGAAPYVSAIDQYNGIMDIMVARFDGYVFFFEPGLNRWVPPFNNATMINTVDHVHPLDTGAAWYTHNMAALFSERIP